MMIEHQQQQQQMEQQQQQQRFHWSVFVINGEYQSF